MDAAPVVRHAPRSLSDDAEHIDVVLRFRDGTEEVLVDQTVERENLVLQPIEHEGRTFYFSHTRVPTGRDGRQLVFSEEPPG